MNNETRVKMLLDYLDKLIALDQIHDAHDEIFKTVGEIENILIKK